MLAVSTTISQQFQYDSRFTVNNNPYTPVLLKTLEVFMTLCITTIIQDLRAGLKPHKIDMFGYHSLVSEILGLMLGEHSFC